MNKLISLGFSCQSKFILDYLNPKQPTMPYDWSITTKEFVLQSLASMDGREFLPDIRELEFYEMPKEGTQGLGRSGIWFWHDFPRKGHKLDPNWSLEKNYLTKYPILWARFLHEIRNSEVPKIFIISNSQSNLDQFSNSSLDFSEKFGIDSRYLIELTNHLNNAGAKNYELMVLLRGIEEFMELTSAPKPNVKITAIFVGSLSLPFHIKIADSLFKNIHTDSQIASLIGLYDNGAEIVEFDQDLAIVLNSTKTPWAIARLTAKGYIFSFSGSIDNTFTAAIKGDLLLFSNKTKWKKVKST